MTETVELPQPTPTLPQLLAAWLEEHNAEISIGVRTPTGDATIGIANFVPVMDGWLPIYVPVVKK